MQNVKPRLSDTKRMAYGVWRTAAGANNTGKGVRVALEKDDERERVIRDNVAGDPRYTHQKSIEICNAFRAIADGNLICVSV